LCLMGGYGMTNGYLLSVWNRGLGALEQNFRIALKINK
jgi:hypothetical protein